MPYMSIAEFLVTQSRRCLVSNLLQATWFNFTVNHQQLSQS